MKKIIWFSFLLGLIFLGGCTTTNKLSQADLFQKKQECAKYQDVIKKEIQDYNDQIRQIEQSQWINMKHSRILWELFYSPIKNSCLYSIYLIEETAKWDTINWYKMKDFFDKGYEENFIMQDENGNWDIYGGYTSYQNRLKELKWE